MDIDLTELASEAEMILIGIGSELSQTDSREENSRRVKALKALCALTHGKTYFAVSENEDDLIYQSGLLPFFITAPFDPVERKDNGEDQWNSYLRWLSGTLGHSLLVLELGVGFQAPQLIRWPFERTVQMNFKSRLVRVQKNFPQLPKELSESGRGISIAQDPADFLLAFSKRLSQDGGNPSS